MRKYDAEKDRFFLVNAHLGVFTARNNFFENLSASLECN